MASVMKLGILGCGDFLRWQAGALEGSSSVKVASLYDPDSSRAQKYADKFKARVANTPEAIFDDPAIDIVCLFVPPWIRKDQIARAASAGKHIITTKPLGPTVGDCQAMVDAVGSRVKAGVLYGRSGNDVVETYRDLFDSGDIGRLALMRQDWLHHYPQWNTWALDPSKNGGPFMDAMIHNLNVARYLMVRPATHCAFFSDKHAHDLPCADTEFMKIDFEGNGSAHLFITWAADLAVYSTEGNDREHIDKKYMVTDKGWYVTEEDVDGKRVIQASRLGEKKVFPFKALKATVYDRFVSSIVNKTSLPRDIPSLTEAYQDIKIIRDAEKSLGQRIRLELAPRGGTAG